MYQLKFKKKLIASCVASCAVAGASSTVLAQQDGEARVVEEVIIQGVRGAQETSVNLKRDASSIMDAISAEDIGKLPDVTISDSLQRIPGVQIRRSAGEGSAINVRGLPQVVSQLNGEQYLGAGSVLSNQPNYGDIPSQLFRGAEVYKSPTANMASAGISGTVNLKTFRPFDLDEGWTFAGAAEVQRGKETGETDPVVNGLVNWNGDNMGFLISAAYANVNLANSYNGVNGDTGWVGNRTYDGLMMMAPQGWAAWNQVTERERLGVNASFQADLGGGFEFVADFFYTDQDEYNRKIGMSATDKWATFDFYTPTEYKQEGDTGWASFQEIDIDFNRLKSFTQNDSFLSSSRNLNLELNFDNGGPFTASARYVQGRAEQLKRHGYNEGDLTDTATTLGMPDGHYTPFYPADVCDAAGVPAGDREGDNGGCFLSPNPTGYNENPMLTLNFQGDHAHWSGFDRELVSGTGQTRTIAEYMADPNAYSIGAYSSENNYNQDGDMDVFRVDVSYAFEDGAITSLDAGLRNSRRSGSNFAYNLVSPFYDEGCLVQWKATDVVLSDPVGCSAGETIDGEFHGYTTLPPTPLDAHADIIEISDYGPVTGIPSSWVVDPKAYDDPLAFHDRVFGSNEEAIIPGQSFDVDLEELQYYMQVNFDQGMFSGNLGARVVTTDLHVRQNEVAGKIPYGNLNADVGDIHTYRSYTDFLPSANLTTNFSDNLLLRASYSENMVPLSLGQWGESLVLNYTLDAEAGSETEGQFIVSGGSQGGNPAFDPWRSANYDLSLEYYFGGASMVSAGVFLMEVDSFIGSASEMQFQPDDDGIVRRQVAVGVPFQGEGGELKGVELATKLALADFTDAAILSNFGFDVNYTYSPSEQDDEDIYGDKLEFPDNSEHQANLITWFQADRFQARVAYNYRSDRLVSTGQAWSNLAVYQDATSYVDVSASYDVTDAVTVYLNGSNVTGEYEHYYMQFDDQYAHQSYYEPRYTLGVRARF